MKPNSLDYWRGFFRTDSRDVFDIVEGAIIVAMSDCPQEFKLRRGRIAERLFSSGLTQCQVCERVELLVPSDGDDQGGSKESKVNSTGRDDRWDLSTNQKDECIFREAEALTDEIEESRILEAVLRIKEILMKYEEESESVLLESLRRLQLMGLTVAMLKGTGIGIAVNMLRKHRSKQICQLAQTLIKLWKSMVDVWLQTTQDIPGGTPDSVNPSNVVDKEEEEEEGLPSPPMDEGGFLTAKPTTMELSGFFDGMDDAINARKSGGLPKKCEKGRKSSLHNPSRNAIDQQIEKRPNETKNSVRNEKPEPLRKESPVVKPNGVTNVNSNLSVERKINKESKPQPTRLDKPAAINKQGQNSENQKDDSKINDADQMKLRVGKRKLRESCGPMKKVNRRPENQNVTGRI